jgi:WD40 repeat protein
LFACFVFCVLTFQEGMFKVHEITPAAHAQDIWTVRWSNFVFVFVLISTTKVAWRGTSLATGSLDQTVKLWRAGGGAAAAAAAVVPTTLKAHTMAVVSVDVSGDGNVASSGLDSVVALHDSSGAALHTLRSAPGECYALRFAPSSSRLATTSKTGTVSEWDVKSGARLRTLEAGGRFGICVA